MARRAGTVKCYETRAEVAEAVGRGYYESGAAPGAGKRNGYRRNRLRTAEGAIEHHQPFALRDDRDVCAVERLILRGLQSCAS